MNTLERHQDGGTLAHHDGESAGNGADEMLAAAQAHGRSLGSAGQAAIGKVLSGDSQRYVAAAKQRGAE